jgi:prevent-host-death family protein
MAKVVNIHAAKTHFSKLVEEVEAGGEVTIARAGKPVMRLVKYVEDATPRTLGFAEGEITDLDADAWAALDSQFNALFEKP